MNPSGGITTITTGVESDEKSIIWEIKNFPVIQKQVSMVNRQMIQFEAGGKIGLSSEWSAYLLVKTRNDKQWIGIFYSGVKMPEKSVPFLYSRMAVHIKNKLGVITWDGETTVKDIADIPAGWGFPEVLEFDQTPCPEILEIHITFKLYSPTDPACPPRLQRTLEEFQAKFVAEIRKDLKVLLENPVSGDIKIVASDGMEFQVSKGTLAARSPVFQAMFRTNMTEANDGLLRLSDITGKTLKVLLHFLNTGELFPEWKDPGVTVELTNAAAKYQLGGLLEFLDAMLGKVCNLESVAPLLLLTLATQLSLKRAEGELLKFVKEEGTASAKSFFQIMKVVNGMEHVPSCD